MRRLFTLLALLLVVLTPAAPSAHQPVVRAATLAGTAPTFGLNSHLATRYPDPSSMDLPAELVADLEVGWVREDFHWHRVQPRRDVWDWTFTDAAMRALLSRNIEVLGVLGPSVGWATPYPNDPANDVSYYAPDLDYFVDYVRGVVSRYHVYIDHWEIWNEPDHAIFWRPEPDPQAYARMLIRSAAVIKEVDPDATVLIGGINPFDTDFLQAVVDAGAWQSFDILALHPYVDPYSPEDGNLIASANAVRGLAARYGPKPIWVTELGWASGPGDRDRRGLTDAEDQASYLVRAMLLLWEAGAERIFWYSFKDDPGNPYGLLEYGKGRDDLRYLKPAFAALRTLNQQVAGAEFVTRYDLFDTSVLLDFEQIGGWLRMSQPNGSLSASSEQVQAGSGSARIVYNFTTSDNDYLVFERSRPLAIAGQPHALGLWVYGDGSGHRLKFWLRDSQGEVLQFELGPAGMSGWHLLTSTIGGEVAPGNRISAGGNGRVDFPAGLTAIVVDDMNDRSQGSGTIYIDTMVALSGTEAYDMRLRRDDEIIDILWSPPGMAVLLASEADQATVIERDGRRSSRRPANGRLRFDIGPAPIYVRHQAP
jgi:hypothetical protein